MKFFRNLKCGIKNLIVWFPIIWQDRNWDHYFIYKILRQKLHLTEQFIRNHGCHIHNERDANQIKLCVNLLDRLIKDNYLDNVIKPHEKKWGKIKMITKEIPNSDLISVDFKCEKAITDKDKEQEEKERIILYKQENNLRKQDLDLLFNHIRKHIEGWWD